MNTAILGDGTIQKSGNPYARLASRLANPRTRFDRLLRSLMIGAWMLLGLAALFKLVAQIGSHAAYEEDFIQDYLMARAIVDGSDPYASVQLLALRYLESIPSEVLGLVFPHPSPHPPTMALLALPFTLMDYRAAALAWLGLELVLLCLSVHLLARIAGFKLSAAKALLGSIMLLGWPPVYDDLSMGQVNVLLLSLLAAMWVALRSGHPGAAGIWLGCTLLIKQLFWPLLLLIALRKQWRVVGAAIAVTLSGYVAAALVVGIGGLSRYLTVALPATTDAYRAQLGNISLWTVSWRVFHGGLRPLDTVPISLPLIARPDWAAPLSVVLPTLALAVGLRFCWGRSSIYGSVALMVCISILVSPIAWSHYLVIALIPLAYVWTAVATRGFVIGLTTSTMAVTVLLLPGSGWGKLALLPIGDGIADFASMPLPVHVTLALLVLTAALGALACLVARLEEART